VGRLRLKDRGAPRESLVEGRGRDLSARTRVSGDGHEGQGDAEIARLRLSLLAGRAGGEGTAAAREGRQVQPLDTCPARTPSNAKAWATRGHRSEII
jgi:hypothetical protein